MGVIMKHVRVRRVTMIGVAMGMGLLAGVSGAWAQGGADPNKVLPAFRLAAPDGQEVMSSAISGEPRWLLLYVSPRSPASRRLVAALKDWQSPQLIARTVLVVRASVADAQAWAAAAIPPELAGIRWLADAGQEAWTALALHGTPELIGIKKGQIEWRLAGVLNRPGALESVVRTWVEAQ